MGAVVYLRQIRLKHVKLLEDFELSFDGPDGKPRMWTVIIGENGTAKSSILQAIALAAAGPAQVSALAKPIIGHLRDRRTEEPLEIEACFSFAESHANREELHPSLSEPLDVDNTMLMSELRLEAQGRTLFGGSHYMDVHTGDDVETTGRQDPLDIARSRSLSHWFVAGFGVGRFLPDPTHAPPLEVPGIERMESLFRSSTMLTSLRFLDHFNDEKARLFAAALRDTLMAAEELVPDLVGIELRGQGGVAGAGDLIDKERFILRNGGSEHRVPAVALSHGYQSTIAWIADLVGHVMLEAEEPVEAKDIEGVVLLDEIDLYLHPRWQAGLIGALRRTFEKVQFVVTTHSPVVLAEVAPHEIVRVMRHPSTGSVVRGALHPATGELVPWADLGGRAPAVSDPRAMTGTDVYRDWFGLDRLTLNPHGPMLRDYLRLATNPWRDDAEQAELDRLRDALEAVGVADVRAPMPRDVA